MPFNKGDPRINRGGRPSGAKNKVRASRDVSKAVSAGMSLEDICTMLSETIMNPETSDTQRQSALKQLIPLKQFLTKTELDLLKDIPEEKGKETKEKSQVVQFPKTKFKRLS